MRRRKKIHNPELLKNPSVAEVTHISAYADPDRSEELIITYDRELESYMISCSPVYYSIIDAFEDYIESTLY